MIWMNNRQRIIKRVFFVIMILCYGFMLLSVFFKGRNFGIVIAALVVLSMLVALNRFLEKLDDFFKKYYFFILGGMLFISAVIQILQIEKLRIEPWFDLGAIYGGAIELYEQGDFPSFHDYFCNFINNYGALRALYYAFCVGRVFTDDYYWIAACFNEILILATFAFTSLSVRELLGARYGIYAILLFWAMPPFWFMAPCFYTDSLSMAFPVITLYICLRNRKNSTGKEWLLCLLLAIVAYIGGTIKANAYIMAVAVCIYEFLLRNYKRAAKYVICLLCVFLLCHTVMMQSFYRNYVDKKTFESKNVPIIHWIMMGLGGEGRYQPKDYEYTLSFEDPDVRKEMILKEIKKRIIERGYFGMISLWSAKSYIDFSDGTLLLNDCLGQNPAYDNEIHKYLLNAGEYFLDYYHTCCAIFYALLLSTGVGFLYEFCMGFEKKVKSLFLPALAITGDLMFLMMWEATNRYFANYVPVLIVTSVFGIKYIDLCIRKIRKHRLEKENYEGKESPVL